MDQFLKWDKEFRLDGKDRMKATGRSKKTKAVPVAAPAPVPVVEEQEPVPVVEEPAPMPVVEEPAPAPAPTPEASKKRAPAKPKKEKKPIQVVAVVTPDGIEGTFTPEPRRPLIVHLPFNSSEVKFSDTGMFQYDPNPPPPVQPYDVEGQVYFQVNTDQSSNENAIGVEQEGWKMSIDTLAEKDKAPSAPTPVAKAAEPMQPTPSSLTPENFQRVPILACYLTEKGKTFTPPASTNICCYWCSQEFKNMPCFLPVKEEVGVYHVYGNFCTPQCALAYLLKEHLDSHVRWERMALLHRIYKCPRIYPSPPREVLQAYGGPYTYQQYREIISQGKVRVDVEVPPMVSILGTLDTKPIDFYDSSLQNTFSSGFSLDRFKNWSEQGGALRLKRSKPLKDKDSTLDACIQISIKRGGGDS